jgi:hypothetical protein
MNNSVGRGLKSKGLLPAKHHPPLADWYGNVSGHLVSSVIFHAAIVGAYFAQGSNRAVTAVKFTVALGEDKLEQWCNDAEECMSFLAELNETLTDLARADSLIPAPPHGAKAAKAS